MKIPEVREHILTLARWLKVDVVTKHQRLEIAEYLEGLETEMHRRPAVRRSSKPGVGQTYTEDQKWMVLQIAKRNPNMSQAEIARRAGVANAGRVSETLAGPRT